jgi:hypothetical protein
VQDSGSVLQSFLAPSNELESFGIKFSAGGSHISRTMMLNELETVLEAVPKSGNVADYRVAILERNVLGKTTVSTRQKSHRHLRELYALDEQVPIFAVLRTFRDLDSGASLPLLALLTAWARDPLLRATTRPVLEAQTGAVVEGSSFAERVEATFPNQYTSISCHRIARNAASSWTQAGHLSGVW